MLPEENPTCRRCGTCCRRGGPALHRRDKPLVDAGHIPAHQLFTLRPGEPVRDNVNADTLTVSTGDIIKVRSRPGGQACVFFDGMANACTTYRYRPIECRVLNCRDTAAIEAVYSVDRLQRRDLLGGIDGLWDLVAEHERRCSAARLVHLAERFGRNAATDHALENELLEMVRYDAALRQLLVESGRMAAGLLDLVLGRPLPRVLRPLGIEVHGRRGADPAGGGSRGGKGRLEIKNSKLKNSK